MRQWPGSSAEVRPVVPLGCECTTERWAQGFLLLVTNHNIRLAM